MSTPVIFVRNHWPTLGLLIACPIILSSIVGRYRAPGSMTVIEAQGMDMTAIKAPMGALPVTTDLVKIRDSALSKPFPATVAAFSDEDVVARVSGRVSRILVYPGDQVAAGQLLATIDAPDVEASSGRARAMASSTSAEVISAERMIAHHRNVLSSAQAALASANSNRLRAQADLEAAGLELAKSKDDLKASQADKEQRQADVTYSQKDLDRKTQLYETGAISLDALQSSRRDHDSSIARLNMAASGISGAEKQVHIAELRVTAARQMLDEADAGVAMAQANTGEAREGVAQAHADASAKQFEANAADAEASGAAAIVDFGRLRALANGIVSERTVSPGTSVMAGQVVLRLKDLSSVRVQADVPESQSSVLTVGTPVVIEADGRQWRARLTSVFPTVNPETRTFKVEAVLRNAQLALKPGMFVTLGKAQKTTGHLSVEASAIQSDDSGAFVWTVQHRSGTGVSDWTCPMHQQVSEKGPGKCPICSMDLIRREKGGSFVAHRSPVTVAGTSQDFATVSAGLNVGDQVIVEGLTGLVEGMSISPRPVSDASGNKVRA